MTLAALPPVYTVGHSRRSIAEFVELELPHGLAVLASVLREGRESANIPVNSGPIGNPGQVGPTGRKRAGVFFWEDIQ